MSLPVIRVATTADASRVSVLLNALSHTFFVSPTAAQREAFLRTISEPAIRALISRDDMDCIIAEDGSSGALAGAAAMRKDGVLFLLFVDPAYQRKGSGRKLWEFLRDRSIQAGHSGTFSVSSSLVAVRVYEKFGFKVTGERIDKDGGAFVPMKYERPPQGPGQLG